MQGNRSKLKILLSVVALAQILTIPHIAAQTAASIPASIAIEDGQEGANFENFWYGSPRKQRIKRARAARRAAIEASILAQACKRVTH